MRSAAAICAIVWLAAAADYPKPTGYVNDFAGQLSPGFQQTLESRLRAYERSTTQEIAVVTVPSLEDKSIEAYATGLFNAWGIGKRDTNNGVLFLWAPKERKVRIEVGSGLTQVLTDPQAKQIVEDAIAHFRSNDFEGGIAMGIDEITSVLEGAPLPPQPHWYESLAFRLFAIVAGGMTIGSAAFILIFRRRRAAEVRRTFPEWINRSRVRLQAAQATRLPSAAAYLEQLRAEAPSEVYSAHDAALFNAQADLAQYERELNEIALLSLATDDEARSAGWRLRRWEQHMGRTESRLDAVGPTLSNFRLYGLAYFQQASTGSGIYTSGVDTSSSSVSSSSSSSSDFSSSDSGSFGGGDSSGGGADGSY